MEDIVHKHITKAPGVRGGKACITGHRIRVRDIVVLHEMRGLSRDELVGIFPGLTPADVHAALVYFFDNVSEIQDEYRGDEATLRMLLACPPAELRSRLEDESSTEIVADAVPDASPPHLTRTPGICGGKACIAGHRIRVMDIVVWHEMRGYSAAEVAYHFPGITLADVHAALAYHFDHREEIQEEFRRDEEAARELLTRHPSKVQAKLHG